VVCILSPSFLRGAESFLGFLYCSISRVTTFITIDTILSQVQQQGIISHTSANGIQIIQFCDWGPDCDIDIQETVRGIQFSGCILNEEQYGFIYRVVKRYIMEMASSSFVDNEGVSFLDS
jgi:protein tyrosine phosphatase